MRSIVKHGSHAHSWDGAGFASGLAEGITCTALLQIMTTEEWYTIMWGLIDAEFRYSAIYFYAVIVFGSYFFWNIFINGVIAIFLRLNTEHMVGAAAWTTGDVVNVAFMILLCKDGWRSGLRMHCLSRSRFSHAHMSSLRGQAVQRHVASR